MLTLGTRGAGIFIGGTERNATNNATATFECHPLGETHGTLLLGLASAGVIANMSLAGLILARKSLRRWSSGLMLHGTLVDGARAALLLPLGFSVLRCQPVTRCSLVDTAFLLLATVTSLNLLTAALSDAPLLPPPVLVPTLLQSAGYSRSQNRYASPLYPKGAGATSYYSDYYEEDANLLAETTAMPDSPQCVLFATFMVWFAALTINLGPTFLSGALAAQAEVTPRTPSCPLVRGPARHAVLNALWAAVNLLCIGLAVNHLRKLKKDLARARLGLLAAAGAGLAGLAGIANPNPSGGGGGGGGPGVGGGSATNVGSVVGGFGQGAGNMPGTSCAGQSTMPNHTSAHTTATPSEVDAFLRQAQKNGHCHIRTLGTLAIVNLLCWIPLYICALIAPVGTGTWEDPAPTAYEVTLITAFAHSVIHPVSLVFLHEPLRDGLKICMVEWCCCICLWLGMEFEPPTSPSQPSSRHHSRRDLRDLTVDNHSHALNRPHSRSQISPHNLHLHRSAGDLVHIPGSGTITIKRASSLKSDRLLMASAFVGGSTGRIAPLSEMSPTLTLLDDILPPPPLPPANSILRKQASMEEPSPSLDNRW